MLRDSIEMLNLASEPEKSRHQINEFVEKTTKGHIKDLLQPDSIAINTNAILANAAFFRGDWLKKFPKEDTKKEKFYKHDRYPVYVDMMKLAGSFSHGMTLANGDYYRKYDDK